MAKPRALAGLCALWLFATAYTCLGGCAGWGWTTAAPLRTMTATPRGAGFTGPTISGFSYTPQPIRPLPLPGERGGQVAASASGSIAGLHLAEEGKEGEEAPLADLDATASLGMAAAPPPPHGAGPFYPPRDPPVPGLWATSYDAARHRADLRFLAGVPLGFMGLDPSHHTEANQLLVHAMQANAEIPLLGPMFNHHNSIISNAQLATHTPVVMSHDDTSLDAVFSAHYGDGPFASLVTTTATTLTVVNWTPPASSALHGTDYIMYFGNGEGYTLHGDAFCWPRPPPHHVKRHQRIFIGNLQARNTTAGNSFDVLALLNNGAASGIIKACTRFLPGGVRQQGLGAGAYIIGNNTGSATSPGGTPGMNSNGEQTASDRIHPAIYDIISNMTLKQLTAHPDFQLGTLLLKNKITGSLEVPNLLYMERAMNQACMSPLIAAISIRNPHYNHKLDDTGSMPAVAMRREVARKRELVQLGLDPATNPSEEDVAHAKQYHALVCLRFPDLAKYKPDMDFPSDAAVAHLKQYHALVSIRFPDLAKYKPDMDLPSDAAVAHLKRYHALVCLRFPDLAKYKPDMDFPSDEAVEHFKRDATVKCDKDPLCTKPNKHVGGCRGVKRPRSTKWTSEVLNDIVKRYQETSGMSRPERCDKVAAAFSLCMFRVTGGAVKTQLLKLDEY